MSAFIPKYTVNDNPAKTTYLGRHTEYAATLVSFGSKFVRLNCFELNCGACVAGAGVSVYNRCPGCGAEITGVICGCGTWMWMCGDRVVRYIIPSDSARSTMQTDDII